jgi:hypothetical protein
MGMKSRQRKPIEMRIYDPTHEGEFNPETMKTTDKRTGQYAAWRDNRQIKRQGPDIVVQLFYT